MSYVSPICLLLLLVWMPAGHFSSSLPHVNIPDSNVCLLLTKYLRHLSSVWPYGLHTDGALEGDVVMATCLIPLVPRQVWQASEGTGEQVHWGAGWAHFCQSVEHWQLQRQTWQMCHPQGDSEADQTNQRTRYHLCTSCTLTPLVMSRDSWNIWFYFILSFLLFIMCILEMLDWVLSNTLLQDRWCQWWNGAFGSWPGCFTPTASLAICIAGGKWTPVIETKPWWSWLKAVSDSVYLLVPNPASLWETNDTGD